MVMRLILLTIFGPLFEFNIPLILIALLCSLIFMPIASILVHGIDTLLTYFFMFLKSMPACYIYFSHQQALIILQVFTFFLIAWLITWHGRKYMTYRFIVCSFLIMITSYYVQEKEDEQTWYVDVIDVGQGLSVLVRTQDQSLLYDTGARYASGFSMAQSEILPYLRYIGIASLEYLVISHSDNDHAGGASLIEKAMHPRRIKLGEPLRKQVLANSSFCDVGERWALGKLSVTVLSPFKRLKNSNNNSCVLRISDGQHAVLLSGDINKKQEALIVSQFSSQLASQILIAPHHGSKYSSSKLWISVVKPKWVVFSVSAMNRWGFPVQEVVERYKKQSVIRVSSGTSGFIRFKIDSHGIKLQTIREDLAAYWYHRSFFL
ncbi:DNA internalization-related competence protein ComEC/Rec2 [Psychromonas sp. CD1]|uniref:DNA internalization-related competence protein ComEC/Rec2 n=1 Tax=Psychromonas sp. CD1 TaxID=1979839 RepID=UPI000B9BCB19|nr:DNA internalization-related competence protein ComEC/Rec2 [Psychromonas sp. CD1]